MGKVLTGASVSLDGFIWPGRDRIRAPFRLVQRWGDRIPERRANGQVFVVGAGSPLSQGIRRRRGRPGSRPSPIRHYEGLGWPPPVRPAGRVVTHKVPEDWVKDHPDAPFTLVTDGLESAIEQAREIAGDKNIGLTAGKLASQGMELGLVDEIYFDLVPVVLGGGTRYLEELTSGAQLLDGPDILQGERVTHLRYTVRRQPNSPD